MKKYITSCLSISLFISSLYSMHSNNPLNPNQMVESLTRFAQELSQDMVNQVERMQQKKAQEKKDQQYDLEAKLRRAQRAEEKELYRRQLENTLNQAAREEEDARNLSNAWEKAGLDLAKQGIQTAVDMFQEEQQAEHQLRQAAATTHINAQAQSATQLEALNRKLAFFSNPQNIKILSLGAAATAAGIYGAKHGSHLLADMIRHYYRNPSIAQETSLLSFSEKMQNIIFGKKIVPTRVKDVILEPSLAQRIDILAQSIKNTVNNGGYFQNILFYGPPGTGKTMVAQRLARSCGLEYIYFAASSLLQLSTEEALIKITELFEFAKKSNNKLMIIIDEAEKLFAHRRANLDDKTRNLLTQILTYTGTESQDYLVVGLTNLPQELDPAFLSRCDEQIQISPPGEKERKSIITKYIKEYLLTPLVKERRSSTLLSHALTYFTTPKPPVKLTIELNALSNNAIETIAHKTDGFVGRDIAKLILAIQQQAYASKDKKVTTQLINKVVQDKIDQHLKSAAGFNHKFAGI